MKLSNYVALSALLLSGAMLLAQQQQPPLGDVARQEKPKKKAARVITDDDMPSHPTESTSASSTSGASATSSDANPAKPTEAPGDKAAADKKPGKPDSVEVTEMKRRLLELASDEKSLTSRIGELEQAARNEQDPARRDSINHMLERSRNSLERAKYERDDINKKLEDQNKSKK